MHLDRPPRAAALPLLLPLLATAAVLLLGLPAHAQPSEASIAVPDPRPAPSAEDIAAAYDNSVLHEREQALRRAEAALLAHDPNTFVDRLREGPGAAPAVEAHFSVSLYGCAPAPAGEVGHVCHYGYRIADDRVGANVQGPALVRGHVFRAPGGLFVRELPLPPGPYGPREGLGGAPGSD